jgi:hypothetical protein
MKMKSALPLLLLLTLATHGLRGQWTQTSGPSLGSVSQFFVSGDTVYAAQNNAMGSVLRSLDSGKTWRWLSYGLPSIFHVNAIISDGKTIYAGTRDGLFESSDDGAHWIDAEPGKTVYGMCLIDGMVFWCGDAGGIWKTTNNGASWITGGTGLPSGGRVTTLFVDGSKLYANVGRIGVFVSGDLGAHWDTASLALSVKETYGISMVRAGTVLIAASQQTMYRSTDEGATWAVSETGIPAGNGATSIAYNGSVAIACNAYGTFVSHDLGISWKLSDSGLTGSPQSVVALGKIFLAGAIGLYCSLDDGKSWQTSGSGASTSTVTSILTYGDKVIAGTLDADYGLAWKSSDKGDSWVSDDDSLSTIGVNALASTDQTLLCGTDGAGVFYSLDSGNHWHSSSGLAFDGYISAFLVRGNIVLAGTKGFSQSMFRSTDYGRSWVASHDGLSTNDVLSLTLDSNVFFAGINSDGFFHSLDSGVSWQAISTPPEFSPALLGNHLGYQYSAAFKYLYRSNDHGTTWIPDSNGLAGVRASCMVDAGGVLYLGTNHGVFSSLDSGKSWSPNDTAIIANFPIISMCVQGNTLYCGTSGAGVWKEELAPTELVSTREPGHVIISVHPNPFSTQFSIEYATDITGPVTVVLSDMLGRRIQVWNRVETAGRHAFSIDRGDMPAGVYFCNFESNGSFGRAKIVAR